MKLLFLILIIFFNFDLFSSEINKRPTGKVFIKNYCICNKGKAEIEGPCKELCSNRNDHGPVFFGDVAVDGEILNNPNMGTLDGWCNHEIPGGNPMPSCVLELWTGKEYENLNIEIYHNDNRFIVDFKDVPYNLPLTARIIEVSSGAFSDSVAVKRIKSSK